MASRIGFYGGMANNMYVFAKALAGIGADVTFVRDRNDRFAFSQPVWEDVEANLSYAEVGASSGWTWQQWDGFETCNGWGQPDWLVDPQAGGEGKALVLPPSGWRHHLRPVQSSPNAAAVLEAMRACNRLVVCGVEATTLAGLSGRPFIIVPHGGDIRIAAGLARLGGDGGWLDRRFGSTPEALLKRAYVKARAVVTHGPLRIGGPLDPDRRSFAELMPKARFEQLALPVFERSRPDRDGRRAQLESLCARLGIAVPDAEVIAFVPSRVDYYWKGQDRLLPALEAFAGKGGLHVIFSGWGKDYEDLRQRMSSLQATFLPCALSKQMVYAFFQASDLVVDQFVLGHYGTAAQEAMACGAPVVIWIDAADYHDVGRDPPPVINARTPDEIVAAFGDILSDKTDLDDLGKAGCRWILQHHGPEHVKTRLDQLLH